MKVGDDPMFLALLYVILFCTFFLSTLLIVLEIRTLEGPDIGLYCSGVIFSIVTLSSGIGAVIYMEEEKHKK